MVTAIRQGAARATDIDLMPFAQRGELLFAGTGPLSISSPTFARVLFSNPIGYTKQVRLARIRLFADHEAFATIFINPTVGPVTADRNIANAIVGVPYAGLVSLKADVSATPMSGGTQSSANLCFGSGGENTVAGPFLLNPGFTVGFNVSATGLTNLMMNFVWWEV